MNQSNEKQSVEYEKVIANLHNNCEKILNMSSSLSTSLENAERRRLYAEAGLLKIEIESGDFDSLKYNKEKLLEQLIEIQSKLDLKQVTPASNIFSLIDSLIRITAVWQCLFTFPFTLVLPSLVSLPLEKVIFFIFNIRSKYHLSNIAKHFIANYILVVSGVSTVVSYETSEKETFRDASIVCYSHGSTIDAFLISYSISPKTYALSKDDLFLIPYFNLLLTGFSAIPIVRTNLAMAKRSLAYVAQCLGTGECISIAPEGTRSKTGQLIDFKKGPFHTWDHLQVPIVPLVITGAYELYPPGHQMNLPGIVHCQFLKPIQCSEANSKEKMSILLRQRMLQAIKSSPPNAAAPLSWSNRILSLSAIAAIWTIDIFLYFGLKQVIGRLGVSSLQVLYGVGAFTVLSSPIVYAYAVYLMPAASALIARFKLKSATRKAIHEDSVDKNK